MNRYRAAPAPERNPHMARKKHDEIDISPECDEAFERVVELADRLAVTLTGDPCDPLSGAPYTGRATAMSLGMIYFLLRIGPDDLHALFFAERSMSQFKFNPDIPDTD